MLKIGEHRMCLEKIGKSYQLKIKDMIVEIQYSENNKNLKDCINHILKQKMSKNQITL